MESAAAAGGSRFVISSTDAASLAKSSSVSSLLPLLVPSSLHLARPPISNFHVAAVGLSSDGRIFVGVNLEFPNAPLHNSVHAEQFLVASLAAHSAGRLLAVAVSAAPCGHCRQFLQELRGPGELRICVVGGDDDVAEFEALARMLPKPFGPFDLLDDGSPLLLEPICNGLSLVEPGFDYGKETSTHSNPDESCIKNTTVQENGSVTTDAGACNGYCEPNYSQLEIEALEAANRSHAPYSKCPSGVALMDHKGKIYKGSYMESAAYNPSLGPVQAAVVAYVAGGGGAYSDIVAGVLVEREGAVVRQEETARLLLKLIAPKGELRVIHCRSD